MEKNAFKVILTLLSVFMLSLSFAGAAVSDIVASVTPTSPDTDDDLVCSFTVTGDEDNYSGTATWFRNDVKFGDAIDFTDVADGVEGTETLQSSETNQDEEWHCEIDVDSLNEKSNVVSIPVTNKLIISDLDAKCTPSCEDNDLDADGANKGNGGSIKEVEPGAAVTVKIKVENIWPDNTKDHDIEEIELECTLEEIEDDDEQDEDVSFSDLDPGDDSDREELEFDISIDAEDDESYEIECTLFGEDEDGTDYEFDFTIDVEVEKEKHSVVFQKASLRPSVISCNRFFTVDYKVKNIGASDEDDIRVEARIDALDVFGQDFLPELEEGNFDDDDTEFSGTFNLDVENDARAGTYQLRLVAHYDDDDEDSTEILDLIVEDCVEDEPVEPEEEEEEQPPVVVIEQPPKPTIPTTQVVAEPTEDKDQKIIDFTESLWFIVVLVIAILIVLGLVGLLIGILVRK